MDIFSTIDENACTISLKSRNKADCIKELAHLNWTQFTRI
jgi:hypothetical protein